MPIILEPEEKRLYWFAADNDKPAAERPAFVCAAPTRRVMRQHRRLNAEVVEDARRVASLREAGKLVEAETLNDSCYDKLVEMALLGVTGWRNFGDRTFMPTAECLEDVLSYNEIAELAREWPSAFAIGEDDRKNSSSPRSSAAESSAATAVADSAPTPPTQTVPRKSSESPAPPAGEATNDGPSAASAAPPATST